MTAKNSPVTVTQVSEFESSSKGGKGIVACDDAQAILTKGYFEKASATKFGLKSWADAEGRTFKIDVTMLPKA